MTGRPAHRNPFRVGRTDALEYVPVGEDWPDMLARLESLDYRAAIVGPHGSGKTTLIGSLIPRLEQRRFIIHHARLTESTAQLARDWRDAAMQADHHTIIILDGAERLGAWSWRSLVRRARRAAGLIITTHRPMRLPTWVRTQTSADLLARLIRILDPRCTIDPGSLFCHTRGNLRHALRLCYDHHARRPPIAMTGR
jgi:hypothetical protein